MTLARIHDAAMHATTASQRAAPAGPVLRVGDVVSVRILERQGTDRYLVAIGGQTYVAQSEQRLDVGAEVRTRVEQTDERLGLKLLDSSTALGTGEESPIPVEERFVGGLAAQYQVRLRDDERGLIAHAAFSASSPLAMSLGGLYLHKLGQPLSAAALAALHDVQVLKAGERHRQADAVLDVSTLLPAVVRGHAAASETLIAALADASNNSAASAPLLNHASTSMDASGGNSGDDSGAEQERQAASRLALAVHLLNQQDDGNVGRRYGCLPLLVDGRLVELDVALFQQRSPDSGARNARRLVMMLHTEALGDVGVTVQAVDDRLNVGIEATDAQICNTLSAGATAMRELLSSLGWHIDRLNFSVRDAVTPPCGQIIEHALALGTINQSL